MTDRRTLAGTPRRAVRRRALSSVSWLALCLVLSGALTYAYLALVARALPTADYSWFGAFWSLALVIGLGAFLPIEIELTRLIALRRPGTPLPAGTLVAALAVSGLCVVAVLISWPLLTSALGGQTWLHLALLAVCVVSGPQFVLRGLLMGTGRVGSYGTILLVDAALRLVTVGAVLALAGSVSVDVVGWALVAAVALGHLPLLAWLLLRRRSQPAADEGADEQGDDADRAEHPLTAPALGNLMVGSLCAQTLLNAAPVLVAATAAPDERVLAAAFVATFTLVRLPLFVAVPLQSALIRPLTALGAAGDRGRQRRLLVRLLGLVAAVASLAAAVGFVAGPPVVGLLFGERYVLPGADVAILAAASIVHLGLLVTSQALIAAARHGDSARAWIAGLVTAGLVFWAIPDLVAAAAWSFALGSAAALFWTVTVLIRRVTATEATVPSPVEPVEHGRGDS